MKIALFAALTLAAISVLQANTDKPPSLPIDKAAAIAKKVVEEMKLPPQYFVRLMAYYPESNDKNPDRYIAYFEPFSSPPAKVKYIKIFMDGKTSIEERKLTPGLPSVIDP